MKAVAILLLCSGLAAAQKYAFYISEEQYRFPNNDARCNNDLNKCAYLETRTPDHHDYSINFVEVKDDGKLFDQTQLTNTLTQIEKARFNGNQQPVVFIYIHGWHNNAQYRKQKSTANCTDQLYDGDVAKFTNCGLADLAKLYPTSPGAPPRIVGIYLAWHGNDFNWPVLNIVPSYPIRRHYARKTGLDGMAKALQDIVHRIGEHRDDYFVLAMGHSFGSRVLENAAEFVATNAAPAKAGAPQAGFMKEYRAKVAQASSNPGLPNPKLPIDLIFHVNAASSHAVSLATIADWKRTCGLPKPPPECDPDQHPLYFAVSSRADFLTALVMPLANLVFFAPTTDQYHLISAANTPWIQTNKIPRTPKSSESCDNLSSGSFCFQVDGGSGPPVTYLVEGKKGAESAVFWAMNSDHWLAAPEAILHKIPLFKNLIAQHWLISTHGDVWNPGVFGLVKGVVTQKRDDP